MVRLGFFRAALLGWTERLAFVIAMRCLPPVSDVLVRARSVLPSSGAARLVVGLLLLRLCFSFLFVAGFSAVGNFGQELADAFDVIVGPDVDGSLTMLDAFRSRDFPDPYVIGKSFMTNPEPLSRSTS